MVDALDTTGTMGTAAISNDNGDATPPPLPEALITPTTSGITKAEENTGPMKPTDCATTSGRDSSLAPRRSYAGSGLAIGLSLVSSTGRWCSARLRGQLTSVPGGGAARRSPGDSEQRRLIAREDR